MIVLVTGATGVLGRRVVSFLAGRAHAVRAMSRSGTMVVEEAQAVRGDLITGEGVPDAVDGVDAIVHCASDPQRHQQLDRAGTARLIDIALRSGKPHFLLPGIVGSDLIPYSYYQSKLAAESRLAASGLPWTIIRATQFHQLIWHVLEKKSRRPLVVVPNETRFQVLDPSQVAERLALSVEEGPAGRLPDMGGPFAYAASDLARSYLTATGKKRMLVKPNYPGLVWAAFRAGANLTPNRAAGETWNDFVARQASRLRT
ncbi:MAG TPA: NAD(P)H-binding protein [Acidimicrobiia bacterium]